MPEKILLIDGVRYNEWTPSTEDELEQIVKEHAQDVFGEQSIYLDMRQKLKSGVGTGSIPDGFVIVFGDSPHWRIVEVELSSHPLHDHIVAQVGRFISGIENPRTQNNIVNAIYDEITKDNFLKLRLQKSIGLVDIHRFLADLVSKLPILTIIIEKASLELSEALKILRYPQEIKVVEFRTFRREKAEAVHAHLFEPTIKAPPKGKPPIENPPIVSTRNELYQQFFVELIDEYCRQHPSRRRIKPYPQSWTGFGAGKGGLWFQWAFRANKKFSAELYIDTGDKAKNKQYFDRIKEHEAQFGITDISWERLDEKKASRVAIYTNGDIQDVMSNLLEKEKLIQWAIETMKNFSDKLSPVIKAL